jgi:cellobiose phosphorylase
MDIASTQYILGIRPEISGLRIDPCIPKEWKSFSVSRIYRGSRLEISASNPQGVEKGIKSILVDNVALNISSLPVIPAKMLEGKSQMKIEVVMG